MTACNPILIEATHLSKQFIGADGKPFWALHEANLSVKKGQLTALVGADGAGKTTFMRLVAGLMQPTSGTLRVLGEEITQNPQRVQNRISYMPQRFGLYEDLSVQENLNLYADLHGVEQSIRAQRFEKMLEMTDMARFVDRPAGKLSGGMKQKLGLACTLVRTPELLLLDEPSVGVDPLSRRELWKIVLQLVEEENLSVLVNTAYMDEAERCEQVFVMHEGVVLAEGSPNKLCMLADGLTFCAKTPSTGSARSVQAELFDANNLIVDAVPKGGDVNFIAYPNADLNVFQGLNLQPRKTQLEDSFMYLLRAHQQGEIRTKTLDFSKKEAVEGEKAVISVKNLVRKFGDFTAVTSTNFEVKRGEIFGLLGPNGAGKTTTFRMLCGLLPATSGELQVAGMNLRTARAEARAKLGYVAQKFSLYSHLTVRENLEFYGGAYGLRGKSLDQRIETVAQQFELDLKANSGILPAGYKQRLAMAAGLIHSPDILFLDEPTSGIDPLARRDFWRTITALAESGVTIIITTHFMEEAEYCDRIAIQDAGKLLALGTPKQVREQAGDVADMNEAFIAIVENARLQAVKNGQHFA